MSDGNITELLDRWNNGDREALDQVLPLVYDELRVIASRYLRNRVPGITLQSTALVHEAYIRFAGKKSLRVQDRVHFYAIAARVIRGILVDYARNRHAAKRGGHEAPLEMAEHLGAEQPRCVDLLQLDSVLDKLERLDEQQSKIVEMRYFAGLSIEETAECLRVSPATVKRDWVLAKAWMQRKLA